MAPLLIAQQGPRYTSAVAEEIVVETLIEPSDEHVAAFARLVPQLSSTAPPSLEALRAITAQPGASVLLARASDGTIVGTLTMTAFVIPTGMRVWIEDVVVDEQRRGAGIGASLINRALEIAKSLGARSVDLTSRPSREAANALYQRLGFVRRDTNVYRHGLEESPGSR